MHYLQQCQIKDLRDGRERRQQIKDRLKSEHDKQVIDQLKYEKRQIKNESFLDYYYDVFNYVGETDEEAFKKMCMIRCG